MSPWRKRLRASLKAGLAACAGLLAFAALHGWPGEENPPAGALAAADPSEVREVLNWANVDRRLGAASAPQRCREMLRGYATLLARRDVSQSVEARTLLDREGESLGIRYLEEGCPFGGILVVQQVVRDALAEGRR